MTYWAILLLLVVAVSATVWWIRRPKKRRNLPTLRVSYYERGIAFAYLETLWILRYEGSSGDCTWRCVGAGDTTSGPESLGKKLYFTHVLLENVKTSGVSLVISGVPNPKASGGHVIVLYAGGDWSLLSVNTRCSELVPYGS